jgi:hypothetical protein
MISWQWKAFVLPMALAASISIIAPGCGSSKPRVTETTVTQTDPNTGTTVTKTTGVFEKGKKETTTWTSTTLRKD